MKPPECNLCGWNIKYKQIPFDDRYFFLKRKNGKADAVISFSTLEDSVNVLPKEIHQAFSYGNIYRHWERFMNRVHLYNIFLDTGVRSE